jgi:uncharacterized protein (DUF2235 family)
MDTMQPEEAAPAPAPEADKAKAIVLFSDGTGNSSAALFKTNVWRMYEAVDLGPAAGDKRPQIAYYDDGVGTSSFRPLAVLGGAFGWGLKRNVLDIYRYACRNFKPGDDIYVFGFSRGAFTARLVAALIAAEGLVTSTSEAELRHKTLQAYRHFREPFLPRRLQWPTKVVRRIREGLTAAMDRVLGRRAYVPSENVTTPIRFVGVWDTVGAYGGPIVEITRAIDNWFFRLSMPDYKLDERVQCARHALAIDDERDAFHPLLWNEVHEEALVAAGKVSGHRLRQVWFSGMHSDVGGGYPDESLSYISLLWMMDEAEGADLRTLDTIKERILALASSYGPIHDSRAGLGAYYRYQPRKIAAWLHPPDERMLSVQDPAIAEGGRPHGLLRTVHVHESVINRIATGTDRYAPITLPDTFEVEPPEEIGETSPQPTSDSDAVRPAGHTRPLISRELRARLQDPSLAPRRRAAFEKVWDFVWWRRMVYFATLAATLALVTMPLFIGPDDPSALRSDGRNVLGGLIRLLAVPLPSFASTWVDVYANHPYRFLAAVALIVLLLRLGTWLEHTLRDRARAIWRDELTGGSAEVAPSWLQHFRNNPAYQRSVQFIKWRVLPDAVITPLLALLVVYLLLGAYTRAWLSFAESGNRFCAAPANEPPLIVEESQTILTKDLCSASFGAVRKEHRYVVTFDLTGHDPWFDADLPASPLGLRASTLPWGLGYFALPLRRALKAHYLQPVAAIRERKDDVTDRGDVEIYALPMRQVDGSPMRYQAEFTAPKDGFLYVFVNDAVLPLFNRVGGVDYTYFYRHSGGGSRRGNSGAATVVVKALPR